jgi:REP element-mobilizing transposase RayT
MRIPRIKIPATEGEAVYHVMTRVVNGERVIHDVGKEVLRKQLWQVADYCGVQILTYAILSNHFHVLVRLPQFTSITDEELLRRYRVLYPHPTRFQQARLEVIEAQLKTDGPEAMRWRKRQLALMHDISGFMRLVKQRYSIWHNKTHQRYGTLWAERFKSVLVQSRVRVSETMAAYIDLNCVRAGLVRDPKDYRSCGYGEAVAGNAKAREGLRFIVGGADWSDCQSSYRQILFGAGAAPRDGARAITAVEFEAVIKARGKLPLADVLLCRIRYFNDGAVLGSRAFVDSHLARYRQQTGRCQQRNVHQIPPVADWGELVALRPLRRNPFGRSDGILAGTTPS